MLPPASMGLRRLEQDLNFFANTSARKFLGGCTGGPANE